MKILVLQGSFRKVKGLTERVANKFLEGIIQTKPDAEIEKIYIAEKNIDNCRGCLKCWTVTMGECFRDDDMKEILEMFIDADIVVAVTPMYMDNMSSYMKKMWERFFPILSPYFEMGSEKIVHKVRPMKKKGLFLISTGAFPEIKQFDSIILSFERIAYNFQMEYLGQLLRPESHSLDFSREYEDKINYIMDSIKKCGEEFGSNFSISETSLEKAQKPVTDTLEEFIRINNNMWDRMLS